MRAQFTLRHQVYYHNANVEHRITFRDLRLSTSHNTWHLQPISAKLAPPKAAIFESNDLIIKCKKNSKVLWLYWIGRQTISSILEHGDRILQLVKDNPIEIIINNNEVVEGSWEDIAGWVKTSWFGKIMAYNVKFFAWIMPKDQDAINSVQMARPDREDICCFSNEHEAIDFIYSRYPEAYLLGDAPGLVAKIRVIGATASALVKWFVSMKDSLQAIIDFIKKCLL